jgi:hypothetical protein
LALVVADIQELVALSHQVHLWVAQEVLEDPLQLLILHIYLQAEVAAVLITERQVLQLQTAVELEDGIRVDQEMVPQIQEAAVVAVAQETEQVEMAAQVL